LRGGRRSRPTMTRPGLPPIFRSTTSTFETLAQHSLQQKGDPYRPRDSSSAARPPGRHRGGFPEHRERACWRAPSPPMMREVLGTWAPAYPDRGRPAQGPSGLVDAMPGEIGWERAFLQDLAGTGRRDRWPVVDESRDRPVLDPSGKRSVRHLNWAACGPRVLSARRGPDRWFRRRGPVGSPSEPVIEGRWLSNRKPK
jgi:hypothetical protein